MEAMDVDDAESPIPPHSSLLSYPGNRQFKQGTVDKRLELNANSTEVPETANWSFVRETKQFSRQYAHAYFVRLLAMRETLKPMVEDQWEDIPLKPIAELCESSSTTSSKSPTKANGNGHKWVNPDEPLSQGTSSSHEHEQHIALREDITVAIIGTLFKQQPEKPSILQELVDEIELRSESDLSNSKKTNFVSDKDVLLMEDETTRVRLIPSTAIKNEFSIDSLVNGIVCAVKGKPNIDGKFEVHDIIWATPKPCIWPQVKNCHKSKMIFISGLDLGQNSPHTTQLGMLFEYLEGLAGSELEQEEVIGQISRVFFVGNCFANTNPSDTNVTTTGSNSANASLRFTKIAEIAKKLDTLMSQLAKTMEVYIIPGKTDPGESMYPQPPLHHCLFPISKQYPNFHLLSNPTRLQLNISNKAGTKQLIDAVFMDGEPVLDAMRFSNITSPLEMSRKLLQWGHLCPTAPDTLALHPGIKKDIFVLKESPHLLIIGNQNEFKTTQWNKTKIITLPSFSQSSTIGIFTTNDFDCAPMEFKIML